MFDTPAQMLVEDRKAAQAANRRPLPGQAEYLDLLHGIDELSNGKTSAARLVEQMRPYILQKGHALG